MSRRKALLAALAVCGGIAVSTAPLSSAAPTVPPQCGPHPLITQSEGNYYVWVQNPGGDPCWLSVEIPGNIQQPPKLPPPPTGATGAPGAAVYPPQPCPTHVILTQSNGNYYLWLPNPTGTSCWISVEIPGNIVKPPAPAAAAFPPPCPVQPLVYESNGHDYLSVPDPSGKSCRLVIELPVTVPPTR